MHPSMPNTVFEARLRLMAEAIRPLLARLCDLTGRESRRGSDQPDRPAAVSLRVKRAKGRHTTTVHISKRARRSAHQELILNAFVRDLQEPFDVFARLIQEGIPALAQPKFAPSFRHMDADYPGEAVVLFDPFVVRIAHVNGYKYTIDDVVSWLVALQARVGHLPAPQPGDPTWLVGSKAIVAPSAAQAVYIHQSALNPFEPWPKGGKRPSRLPRVSRMEDTTPLIDAAVALAP